MLRYRTLREDRLVATVGDDGECVRLTAAKSPILLFLDADGHCRQSLSLRAWEPDGLRRLTEQLQRPVRTVDEPLTWMELYHRFPGSVPRAIAWTATRLQA